MKPDEIDVFDSYHVKLSEVRSEGSYQKDVLQICCFYYLHICYSHQCQVK